MAKVNKYKGEIKSMLNKVVGEEVGEKIFNATFPERIVNYKAGDVLTFKELKELPENTIIHIYYLDDDGELREDGFQPLYKSSEAEYSAGPFPFPMDEHNDDSEEILDADNSGWTFTIRKAIKVTKAEFAKIEKYRVDSIRATELIDKLRSGEGLTKEEKKEFKKITGMKIN